MVMGNMIYLLVSLIDYSIVINQFMLFGGLLLGGEEGQRTFFFKNYFFY